MGFCKAYDMRGTYGSDFDLGTVRAVGRAIPGFLGAKRVLVGRDARLTSPAVAAALVGGLEEAGAKVDYMGPCTTPMVYFFTAEDGYDASVMITASHNPPGDNGLKVSSKGALPVAGTVFSEVCASAASGTGALPDIHPAPIADDPGERFLARYLSWLKSQRGAFDPSATKLKFAVDCSDGMAGLFARELFGGNVVYLNEIPDGRFPHHSPNPLEAKAREQVSRTVRENGLDFGFIFDGDADRVMVVDGKGEFIQPDYLIPVIASTFDEPGAKVIHDVRTSRGAIEAIREGGKMPLMGKVGHAFAKVLLRESHAVCGGELAGHYYFRDFHFCDSAAFAALRMLSAFEGFKAAGLDIHSALKPVMGRYANSGEMNFKVADKAAATRRAIEAASSFGREMGRETMDGVRLEFEEGWVSIRESNTEPYLRLIVECDSLGRLEAWRSKLVAAIKG